MPVVQIATFESGEREIISVQCCSSRIVGHGSTLTESFHELASDLLAVVDSVASAEKDRLLVLAESIGVEVLARSPVWTGRVDGAAPRRARPRLKQL